MNIIERDKGCYEGIEETIVSGLRYDGLSKHVEITSERVEWLTSK